MEPVGLLTRCLPRGRFAANFFNVLCKITCLGHFAKDAQERQEEITKNL